MLTNTLGWSHAHGNEVVPSPWQATLLSESRQLHVGRTPNPQANAPTRWMGGWKVLSPFWAESTQTYRARIVRRQHRW